MSMLYRTFVCVLGAGLLAGAVFAGETQGLSGENPNPIKLIRPRVAPHSAMAQLGRDIFFDASLSSSGKMACASCHMTGRSCSVARTRRIRVYAPFPC